MKISITILVACLSFIPCLGARAQADGNGVERGEIAINAAGSVPKGVEDLIESKMFENCDFRGVRRISAVYTQVIPSDLNGDTTYLIEYEASSAQTSSLIQVQAVVHQTYSASGGAEIQQFHSSICRDFP